MNTIYNSTEKEKIVARLVAEWKQRIDLSISEKMSFSVKKLIPLYKLQNDLKTLEHIGTGFIYKANQSETYLFTCGHVADNRFTDETPNELWIFFNGELRQINNDVELTISKSSQKLRKDDNIDVAIYKFKDSSIKCGIEAEYESFDPGFITGQSINSGDMLFASLGYPQSRNKVEFRASKLKNRPYSYLGKGLQIDEYEKYGLNSNIHIAYRIDIKRCKDEDGNKITAPDPSGISGGPIVLLHNTKIKESIFIPLMLIGITTFYMQTEGIIYGTLVSPLISLLNEIEIPS